MKRQHEPQRVIGDPLEAEINEKQARSIKYQMTIAKLPLAKDIGDFDAAEIDATLVRDLAAGGFLEQQRNVAPIRGAGAGKSHTAIAIARACIRRGARGRCFNVVDLVNKLEAETRAGRQGRIADHLTAWVAPRTPARRLTLARDGPTRAEAVVVAAAERAVPQLVAARDVAEAFHRLIRGRDPTGLDTWLETALSSPVGAFAQGIAADRDAVPAAIALPWSNGRTEGRICRLKTLKRQRGGRAGGDLLMARRRRTWRCHAP